MRVPGQSSAGATPARWQCQPIARCEACHTPIRHFMIKVVHASLGHLESLNGHGKYAGGKGTAMIAGGGALPFAMGQSGAKPSARSNISIRRKARQPVGGWKNCGGVFNNPLRYLSWRAGEILLPRSTLPNPGLKRLDFLIGSRGRARTPLALLPRLRLNAEICAITASRLTSLASRKSAKNSIRASTRTHQHFILS
jgi:hypothetical protein